MWFAKARKTDPATSHEAAKSVRNISETQQRILDVLKGYGPMNDEQLFEIFDYHAANGNMTPVSQSGLRSRRSELVAMGMVEDSGARQKMASGRFSIVWKAVK